MFIYFQQVMNFGIEARTSLENFNPIVYQDENLNENFEFAGDETRKKEYVNKIGHWTQRQNAKYYSFLKKFHSKFSQKEARRQFKVFKALAQFVKSRNANQCRSHHHKMQKNFNNIQQILDFLIDKHPNIQRKSLKYVEQLQNLQQEIFSQGNGQKREKSNYQSYNENNKTSVGYSFIQAFKNFDSTKPNNVFLMKTADEYPCEQNIQTIFNSKIKENQKYQSNCFPSTGLLQNSFPTSVFTQNSSEFQYNGYLYYPQDLNDYNIKLEEYNSHANNYYSREEEYKKKVIQCQECFEKWYQKVRSLVQSQNQEHGLRQNIQQKYRAFRGYL